MVPYGLVVVPFERTTSFLHGARLGPEKVVREVERLCRREGRVPAGETLRLPAGRLLAAGRMARAAAAAVERQCAAGRLPVMVGGEHTCTLGPVTALRERYGRFGVVHFDAHADLRSRYQGTRYSHASVMRRVADDLGLPHASLGIRALSAAEARFLRERRIGVLPGPQLHRWRNLLPPLLRRLPRRVYLTVDMDFFDPAAVPGVGTPEPGGAGWYRGLALIEAVLAAKELVGADIVELCPPREEGRSVRAAARLLLRIVEKARACGKN